MTVPTPASPAAASAAVLAAFASELRATIPLAEAMRLEARAWNGASLTLAAPLSPNVNDKGCAFGGSLASLMTLAGWGLAKLAADARALDCDIYVQDSAIRYLAPVWETLVAVARLDDDDGLDGFLDTLANRGKARLGVSCAVVLADGAVAATLQARFVALARR